MATAFFIVDLAAKRDILALEHGALLAIRGGPLRFYGAAAR
jgi:hypothetical protein